MNNNILPKANGFIAKCNAPICTLILVLLANISLAQVDSIPKFGTANRSELEMTTYRPDTTAAALYLYDYGDVSFTIEEGLGFVMNMSCWLRIKILKKSALMRGHVSLKYHKDTFKFQSQQITDIRGFTHNLIGNDIISSKLDSSTITNSKFHYLEQQLEFQLPDVRVGSVLEYCYTVKTPITCSHRPDTWFFQGAYPYLRSELRFSVPRFISYKLSLGEHLSLYDRKEENVDLKFGNELYDGPGTRHRFLVKDSPAFKREPYITAPTDYLARLSFHMVAVTSPATGNKTDLQSWQKFDNDFNKYYRLASAPLSGITIKRTAKDIASQIPDPEERMKYAYRQVQNRKIQALNPWMGELTGVKYKHWEGNSEINILLIELLRKLDLDCEPLLARTKSHGAMDKERNDLDNFNYLLAYVKLGEKEFFLDATQPFTTAGLLPEYLINTNGRIVPHVTEGRFVELPGIDILSKNEVVEASIDPDKAMLAGKYSIQYGGYDALRWRNKYLSMHDTVFNESLRKQFREWKIDSIEVSNQYNFDQNAVEVNCNFQAATPVDVKSGFNFNPVLAGGFDQNPFMQEKRKYPLTLNAGVSNSFTANYRIPLGYVVQELPKSTAISLLGTAGKFVYNLYFKDNTIHVNTSLSMKKLTYDPSEYVALRDFFAEVVKLHAQKIHIKKISD